MLIVNRGLESVYLLYKYTRWLWLLCKFRNTDWEEKKTKLYIRKAKFWKAIGNKKKPKKRKSQEGKAVRGRIVRNLELALLGLKASNVSHICGGLRTKLGKCHTCIFSKKKKLLTLKSS